MSTKVHFSRRHFLAKVGQGMMVAGIGTAACDMGLASPADAAEKASRLSFGNLDPLVSLLQETHPDKLISILKTKLEQGVDLRQLAAAGAIANARAFGGEDYIGFHTLMAFSPAYSMSQELPSERRALPIMKVLHRNSRRLHETGGNAKDTLVPVAPATIAESPSAALQLREAARKKDMASADAIFATIAQGSPEDAYNQLLYTVEDNTEVHRVGLAYRSWDMLGFAGKEYAQTLLRQSVHYCVKNEHINYAPVRDTLAKLMEQYRFEAAQPGTRTGDDKWVEDTAKLFYSLPPKEAAGAAAAMLAEGFSPTALSEAISLAANELVLRDKGRLPQHANEAKPAGSVHGDSVGVHSCDAVNAWRNIVKVSNSRNAFAGTILSAYQVAQDRGGPSLGGDEFFKRLPRPWAEDMEKVQSVKSENLLHELESAIRGNDQARACALVQKGGELGHADRPIFDLLLQYAISEDGALHAEKFYRTVTDEYAFVRPKFRRRYLISLARVTASEYGYPAPGYAEACDMMKIASKRA